MTTAEQSKPYRSAERFRCPQCHRMVVEGHRVVRFGDVVVHDRCATFWAKRARRG